MKDMGILGSCTEQLLATVSRHEKGRFFFFLFGFKFRFLERCGNGHMVVRLVITILNYKQKQELMDITIRRHYAFLGLGLHSL